MNHLTSLNNDIQKCYEIEKGPVNNDGLEILRCPEEL